MKHTHLFSSALLAGMMAFAGIASAQNPGPVKPSEVEPASREAVRAEARANNKSPANTLTPGGEASTKTNNQPNMAPTPISGTTRGEVRQEVLKTRPQFGQKGERPAVPTNPKHETGTPQ
ncbi:serine/threonine protein kinase [Variovorax sp. J22G21]|uniref:serine/threonine protein kinase n=1 Tax=Variovorax fucosicus TaxID=3053517 RepID=UPI002578861F|nr:MULTISPECIES: serine/threonine protein kinase [unclassified Variovorax]MDM0039283.1 serine/threonine protein kinase [Variovorax sp. J22R193]MDM0055113.1 serine/threonine protein kinase [Variovorax sp. J22G47]MDM0064059.1 serine/threonine protein kinase [Variovorax sp. J22G21]